MSTPDNFIDILRARFDKLQTDKLYNPQILNLDFKCTLIFCGQTEISNSCFFTKVNSFRF